MTSEKAAINVLESPQLATAFTEYLRRLDMEEQRYREAECKLTLVEAEGLEREKKFRRAGERYAQAFSHMLKTDLKCPIDATNGGGVRCALYLSFTMDDCLTAMTCANGVSRCLYERGKFVEALDWCTEVDVLHKNARFGAVPQFDWKHYLPYPPALEFHRQRLLGLLTASDVFLKLGNTGSAAYCRNLCRDLIQNLPSHSDQYVLHQEVLPYSTFQATMTTRHPDPTTHRSASVTEPVLQVRGAWQRLKIQGSKIASRMDHACFIYKSRLYVCGGQRSGTFEVYHDLWCLDLVKLNGWRELPPYNTPFLDSQMVVHNGKAYLFRGYAIVDYFDLDRERWGRIQTHFLNARGGRAEWPWSQPVYDYGAHIVGGKMYVFGGKCQRDVGSDMLAVLDIEKKTWTRLTGAMEVEPLLLTHDCPGPRKNVASWVDGKQEKIYVMYGMADRPLAELAFASSDAFPYDDCWSWDITKKVWRRERVAGNFPCPRAEMSVCYNSKLNSTVIFGGYSPALPFYAEPTSNRCYGFHYFSDTFILDQSSPAPRWRQVITPSFPTYRAQGQLLTDPATGKMYLFGGYTNTDWVPAGKSEMTRSYGDIWQLLVDVPGGLFESVDWEDEKRTAQLGPWQVCYVCNAVGIHKKCAGSCGGRVFYCTPTCQKHGWPEHKEKHGCRR